MMCEVLLPDMSPHPTNNRAACAEVASKFENQESWFGIEQEFTLFEADGKQPLGFPEGGFPEAQGPYYCSVGARLQRFVFTQRMVPTRACARLWYHSLRKKQKL